MAPAELTGNRRFVLGWVLMVGGLVGLWCCRPWLDASTFNYGQFIVLLLTWKVARVG